MVEDNCDVFGFIYMIDGVEKKIGIIGYIGISSFYFLYYMIMGEGGVVYINDFLFYKLVNLFCDWGCDCWCVGGVDNICKYCFSK